jgi:hypothetical protein
MDMEVLAQDVADELDLGRWENDLLTREIGSARDIDEAIERIESVHQDAVDALICLHKAAAAARKRPPRGVHASH